MHDDDLPIDEDLVRRLLRDGYPAGAALPLRRSGASGSSNALFRLGEELLVRLPRQPGGSATIGKEARWSSVIGGLLARVPVPVPEVLVVGEPGHGYPERWSVVRWLPGEVPTPGAGGVDLARDLAAVVVALRSTPVPPDAPADPDLAWYRAGPLAALDDDVREALLACRHLPLGLDLDAAARVWDEAMALPPVRKPEPRWVHADLFAENLLVRGGRLAAVLDLGGLCVGDPSVDLAVAWEVLDDVGRAEFRRRVAAGGVDEDSWWRGRAWALAIALITFPYYWESMPRRCAARLVAARAATG